MEKLINKKIEEIINILTRGLELKLIELRIEIESQSFIFEDL